MRAGKDSWAMKSKQFSCLCSTNRLFYTIIKIFLAILVEISFREEYVLFDVETCHFWVDASVHRVEPAQGECDMCESR